MINTFKYYLMKTQQLLQAMRTGNQEIVCKLAQEIGHQIQQIQQEDNSTLLHNAARSNNHKMLKNLLQLYDTLIQALPNIYTVQSKKQWVNQKDTDGFTPLHYTVYRANYKSSILLEEHLSDIYAINLQGLSVLHVAAQGDSPLLMFYYLNKGLKISCKDCKGSTPLHWACYSGQECSVSFLISWGAQLDIQDFTYGLTPLHLAVMSGNGRIVKKLLIKGCDRHQKNYNGQLALDIARQNQYNNIAEMIIDNRGIQELFNIKIPYRKIGRYNFAFFLFLFLLISNFIFNLPAIVCDSFSVSIGIEIGQIILILLILILFFLVGFKNPGYLHPDEVTGYFLTLQKNNAENICFDCQILKPKRSKHCEICQSCVSVYDHHCPWIGNCVGAKNYFIFFFFLLMLETVLIYNIIFRTFVLYKIEWVNKKQKIFLIFVSFYGLICSLLFFIPLIILIYVQTSNCLSGLTTYQRYSSSLKSRSTRSERIVSTTLTQGFHNSLLDRQSYSSGVTVEAELSHQGNIQIPNGPFQNCLNMCFRNKKNSTFQIQN